MGGIALATQKVPDDVGAIDPHLTFAIDRRNHLFRTPILGRLSCTAGS
jgi:hypothetical protein